MIVVACARTACTTFLEIEVAKDCVRAWSLHRKGKKPTLKDKCEAIIYYAQNDAFLPPPDAPRYKGPPIQLVDPKGGWTQGPAVIIVPSAGTRDGRRKRGEHAAKKLKRRAAGTARQKLSRLKPVREGR